MERGPCLETVRALHQTVVALRGALEKSKDEIQQLKARGWPEENPSAGSAEDPHEIQETQESRKTEGPQSPRSPEDTERPDTQRLRTLESENEALKRELKRKIDQISPSTPEGSPREGDVKRKPPKKDKENFQARISIKSHKAKGASLESLTVIKGPLKSEALRFTKTLSLSNLRMSDNRRNDGGGIPSSPTGDLDQEQEVDDIELIFTTDDTKDSDFKEQLVSIETGDSHADGVDLLQCPVSDLDQNLDCSDRELDDDVFNDNFEESADFLRENSRHHHLYTSKSDNSINNQEEKSLRSCYSYQDSSFENKSLEKDESFDRFEERIRIVETDISKCGIQDVEYGGGRRNTCPNPLQYRPLLHREALAKVSRKSRPILAHSNAVRKESGAQTDISALPGSTWLSESNLNNKVHTGENFTTLPSKYPHPGSRLRLSEKTVEARRVLLSDIGFTSMVPELSRSADHLCPNQNKPPAAVTYGQFLKASDLQSSGFTSQRFTWTTTTATPSEGSYTQSRYNSYYPLSSPPAPSRRCSAPVSPSRRAILKTAPSRVRFANGSLPELRSEWTLAMDSGDSTDSLVEEAENYLRRSIDCIVTSRDPYMETKRVPRRASAPDSSAGDNVPPQGWQPFLPRVPRDLKPDHWVKVITPEGRVRGGRVRYVGPVVSQTEPFVGVQLCTPDGPSDGTFSSRRYFQCEPYHGIFVPFKKVIMGWRP